jgi:hypothetical protein
MMINRNQLRYAFFALLCTAALTAFSIAQTPETTPKLPDTPVGNAFGEFIKAFNTGELETLRRFHRERGGNEANAEKDLEAYKQTGGLKLHSLKATSEYNLEALVQAKQDGQWLSFNFTVGQQKPYPIAGIQVRMTDAPAGEAAKKPNL